MSPFWSNHFTYLHQCSHFRSPLWLKHITHTSASVNLIHAMNNPPLWLPFRRRLEPPTLPNYEVKFRPPSCEFFVPDTFFAVSMFLRFIYKYLYYLCLYLWHTKLEDNSFRVCSAKRRRQRVKHTILNHKSCDYHVFLNNFQWWLHESQWIFNTQHYVDKVWQKNQRSCQKWAQTMDLITETVSFPKRWKCMDGEIDYPVTGENMVLKYDISTLPD